MNAYNLLEYNKIKEIIASECQSDLGREIAISLTPLTDKEEIEYRLSLTSEFQELLKNKVSYNFENVSEINELLLDFKHQTYDFYEFKKIKFNVSTANRISKDIKELEDYPLFLEIVKKIKPLYDIENQFSRIFTPEGDVKDNASSALLLIRKRKKKLRENVISNLNIKIRECASRNYMFDEIITQRDGRYVIPVKDSSVPFIPGIVHGRSGSKSSVYIEPEEVVGMNNEIDLMDSEEKEEIFRIFKSYTKDILNYKDEILENTNLLKSLDYYFAAAGISNNYNSQKPKIDKHPVINLIQARHPLLIETFDSIEKVIPFDLELGKDYRLLLISGPNTGGKTVTLKTVGLICLMALSGLPIPAEADSRIGIFSGFFADIGDYQSLENSLSTFSSHIKNIKGMIDKGDENSLILIDEIGAATDPEQGSALAQSILEKLVENKVIGVITTHYTALKIFAEQNQSCTNAAMQFDPERHSPTYQFKLGLPGNSFSIEVASQLGLNKNLINRAKNLAGNQNVELTDLLKKITEEKNELSRQNYQYKLKTYLLNQNITEYQKNIKSLEKETKKIKKSSIREAREFLATLQKKLNLEISDIKKSEKKERKELLDRSFQKIVKMNEQFGKIEDELSPVILKPIEKAEIGQKVWVKDFDGEGEIVEIKDSLIKVNLNDFIFSTTIDNLYQLTVTSSKKGIKKKNITVPSQNVKFELKILGYRFDEALPEIETFIDNACMNELNIIRIVHGKGTGALRNKVRQYLRTNKKVKEFYSPPPALGGDGVTVATLVK
jgi:DNA mismatch repair protein MutS2